MGLVADGNITDGSQNDRDQTIAKTGHQLKAIKQLAHRKDVSEVVIATDAGREGELVARWILEWVRCDKPVKRLWIFSDP